MPAHIEWNRRSRDGMPRSTKLRAKSDQAGAEGCAKFDEQLKSMRASRDAANKKLHEMRAASEAAWQHMQAGVDAAWTTMKNALDKASSQFKK
jgi:hypothetical protein